MNIQNATSATETDAEIIGLLTAISVVSKRLANNLRKLQEQKNCAIPGKMDTKKASKNEMNRSISLVYENQPHLFHGLLDNEPLPGGMMYRRKNEVAQGQFDPAQAYHTSYSLSSNFRGINAK